MSESVEAFQILQRIKEICKDCGNRVDAERILRERGLWYHFVPQLRPYMDLEGK